MHRLCPWWFPCASAPAPTPALPGVWAQDGTEPDLSQNVAFHSAQWQQHRAAVCGQCSCKPPCGRRRFLFNGVLPFGLMV